MHIVAIANQKGGVGKTTTAVNLSAALAAAGKHILLIDLDPQGNAGSALGIENPEGRGIYGPLVGDGAVLDNLVDSGRPNLHIIPADLNLAGAEIEVARMENHLGRLREILEPLKSETGYDYAFLDCPPSLGILMTNALAAASEILVPIQCEYFALEGLSKIVLVLESIRASGANADANIGGILMTMFDSRTNLSQQVVEEVRKHFGSTVYQTIIPRTIRLGEAPSFGKSIAEYDPRSQGTIAYHCLANEFLQRRSGSIQFRNSPPGA